MTEHKSVDHKSVRVLVYGRVQGVFFRDSCRRRASELGVRGLVRNRADGTVEAVFCGHPADVDALVSWAHTGPPDADVTEVRIDRAPEPDLDGFEIR